MWHNVMYVNSTRVKQLQVQGSYNHGMQFRMVPADTGDTYRSDDIPVCGPPATGQNMLECYNATVRGRNI